MAAVTLAHADDPARSPAAGSARLVLTDVHRAYQGRAVLQGASLTLHAGAVAWLGGRNGAGKTTLLRIASGLVAPDRGTVTLDGLDPVQDRADYQRALGFLGAGNGGLYARLPVKGHLDLWASLALLPRRRRREAIAASVARFALQELLDRRVDRLSLGQRQRVRLASAFLHDPTTVLLDEPHTSLDEEGVALLAAAVDEAAARGAAVLWCSPSLALDHLRHDATHRIEDGRVVAER